LNQKAPTPASPRRAGGTMTVFGPSPGEDAVRNASEYDVYLPLTYNDGTRVEPEKIAAVKKRLQKRFGGLTFFPQRTEGLWKVGGATFRDDMVICRVLSDKVRESREFFRRLKEELEAELHQKDVLIVERKVEVL
jgi:hypothetical protein